MTETFVDLTYRGLSLGRRVRLSQVRPSTGYLELSAPMPVGARIAIATDDGCGFEATVTAVHEQITGSDRAPGMTVAPALASPAAAAWWTARVALPEDDALRSAAVTAGGRTRPVTVRPRARATPTPPPIHGAVTVEVPAIAADLEARVTAASAATGAGVAASVAAAAAAAAALAAIDPHEARTLVMPMHELERLSREGQEDEGGARKLAAIAARSIRSDTEADPAGSRAMRATGDHDVIDDGSRTTIMETIDPAMLGLDLAALAAGSAGAGSTGSAGDVIDDPDEFDGEVTDPGDPGDPGGSGDPSGPGDTLHDRPIARPPRRRKRKPPP